MDFYSAFDLATFIYCDYGALSTANRALILQKIYQALKPGGRLLLDVFSLAKFQAFAEARTWEHFPLGGFWRAEPYLETKNCVKYPEHVTLEQYVIVTDTRSDAFYIWNTYFTPDKLEKETTAAGFRTIALYGDVSGSTYSAASPYAGAPCRKIIRCLASNCYLALHFLLYNINSKKLRKQVPPWRKRL